MDQQIPFHKPSLGQLEIEEVIDTLRSGWLTTGPKARRFEAEFARYVGRTHAVAVNSCTAALHLALEAIGLKAGESVLVPTLTFAATAEVVRYFNARPLLVDCRETDFNLDPVDAERRLKQALARGETVRALVPVHYGGQMAEMDSLQKLAQAYGLRMVEDAAHCCPAYYRSNPASAWRMAGSMGEIGCFSFYANKTITTGEGGMACTDDPAMADRMRIMSLHGISRDAWKRFSSEGSWYYEITAPGFKYNLTDLAAALGLHQLEQADVFLQRRTQLAAAYSRRLAELEEVIVPTTLPDRIHSWHLYAIRLRLERLSIDRAEVIQELKKAGIGASVHWMPLHMHPYYRETYGYRPEDLPQAARLYPEMISLPIYPDLADTQVEYICSQLQRIIHQYRRKRAPGRAAREKRRGRPHGQAGV